MTCSCTQHRCAYSHAPGKYINKQARGAVTNMLSPMRTLSSSRKGRPHSNSVESNDDPRSQILRSKSAGESFVTAPDAEPDDPEAVSGVFSVNVLIVDRRRMNSALLTIPATKVCTRTILSISSPCVHLQCCKADRLYTFQSKYVS